MCCIHCSLVLAFSRPIVDRSTILGYMAYCATELFIVITFYSAYSCNITLFISSCIYLEALCTDFERMFHENAVLNLKSARKDPEKRRRIIEAIHFHAKIERFEMP